MNAEAQDHIWKCIWQVPLFSTPLYNQLAEYSTAETVHVGLHQSLLRAADTVEWTLPDLADPSRLASRYAFHAYMRFLERWHIPASTLSEPNINELLGWFKRVIDRATDPAFRQ